MADYLVNGAESGGLEMKPCVGVGVRRLVFPLSSEVQFETEPVGSMSLCDQ